MKKDEPKRRPDSLSSIVGAEAIFDGALTLDGSLRVDGEFRGNLTCGGSVTIGEGGSVTGVIVADEVILGGRIDGQVVARRRMVLEASCQFEGELACGMLHVNEGAQFNGTSAMGTQAVEELAGRVEQAGGTPLKSSRPEEPSTRYEPASSNRGFDLSMDEPEEEQQEEDATDKTSP